MLTASYTALFTAVMSTLTFTVSVWIAVALRTHQNDHKYGIPLATRLRHPRAPCDELAKRDGGHATGG